MTAERFEQIIAAFGSDPARWPLAERQAASDFLALSPRAQALVTQSRALDEALDHYRVPAMPAMERRVTAALREATRSSLLDRVLEWLLPRSGALKSWAWRPALVACLPLVCGIYMANFYSFGITAAENSWQEELYLISMNDYAEISE